MLHGPAKSTFQILLCSSVVLMVAAAAHVTPKWSYDGKDGVGPQSWGEVAKDAAGKEQSPIALPVGPTGYTNLPVKYDAHVVQNVVNNGHTWQLNFADTGGQLQLGETTYDLLQFHFHTPSEHTMLGAPDALIEMTHASGLSSRGHYPMEMHLVHKSKSGQLAVIGVFVKEGAENEKLNEMWNALADEKVGKAVTFKDLAIDAYDLLPAEKAYQWYDGSLTTPPCTEKVRWMVITQPIEMSRSQINQFIKSMNQSGHPFTNRPLQACNHREVTPVTGEYTLHAPPIEEAKKTYTNTKRTYSPSASAYKRSSGH